MAYLNYLVDEMKFAIFSSHRIHSILSVIVFIMIVNILTCLTTSVDFSSSLDKRPSLFNNQYDLPQKITINNQERSTYTTSNHPTHMPLNNSTGDTRSRLKDETTENIILSHNEPDLDNGLALSNQSPIGDVSKQTPNTTQTSTTTTTSFFEDEDYLNRYLHNSLASNYADESTTLSSIGSTEPSYKHDANSDHASANIESSSADQNQSSPTTTPLSVEILQTSESQVALPSSADERSGSHQLTTSANVIDSSKPNLVSNPDKPDSKFTGYRLPSLSTVGMFGPDQTLVTSPKPPFPQASLADLLQIVKHLNLVNKATGVHQPNNLFNRMGHRTDYSMSNLHQLNYQPQTGSSYWPLSGQIGHGTNPFNRPWEIPQQELFVAESSSNKVDQPLTKDLPNLMPTEEPPRVQKSTSGVTSDKKYENIVSEDSVGKKHKGKPSRYALVSPYSASFDLGITSRQAFPNRAALDRAQAAPTAADKLNGLISRQKFYDKIRPPQLNQEDESLNRHGSQHASTIYYAADDGVKAIQHSKLISANSKPLNQRHKISSNIPGRETGATPAGDTGTKRGERTSNDKRSAANLQGKIQIGSKRPSEVHQEENGAQPSIKVNQLKGKRDDKNKVKSVGTEGIKVEDALLNVRVPIPADGLIGEEKFSFPNHALYQRDPPLVNPLTFQNIDDAYKKSLYYVQERPGYNLEDQPPPLTIGELANQHGVPFRLKSPLGDNYQIANTINEPRIPQESNQYEDFVYMPHSRNSMPESLGYNLDTEMKKKLAMKTIEDIVRDPELPSSLLGNLLASSQEFSDNPSNMQKLYPNLMAPSSGLTNFYQPLAQAANQIPLNMILPIQAHQDQAFTHNFAPNEQAMSPLKINSSLNHIAPELAYRWAISRMPDLIPIPLAATVPGYLIRLPNGQILAAALTNSFSIQGIQKGPLSPGYKSFLNQRFKNLIKPSSSKQASAYPVNHIGSASGISAIALPAPQQINHKGPSEKGGLFSRGVLSQLGFTRSSRSSNTSRETNKTRLAKPKLIKFNNGPHPIPSFSEQELATLPVASINEPVFSFADESQLIDGPNTLSQPTLAPNIETGELFNSDSALAIRAKLNQMLSLRNLFGEEMFQGTKKRRSPPGGFEPPTFWLTAKRASRLRHGGMCL